MAKHTKTEAELTRARIVSAALQAFARHGVQGAGLGEVARQAGVSRGAIYWHFADKTALLQELLGRLRWPLDIGARLDAYQSAAQPLSLLHRCLAHQIGECREDPVQWPLVQWVLREAGEAEEWEGLGPRAAVAQAAAVRHLESALAVAARRGHLREGLEPALAARCLHAVGRSVLAEPVEETDPAGYRRHVDACLGFLMDGMAPGTPRAPLAHGL
ncbi:TetR family transcriptional regulator [Acidovorax sp. SUPP2522]|uniref:TetR family transcriptional regulator n=1 Tax=unclassified Acidovorax TaxID=2684926 RepID=UPI00234A0802|nr:MULTISPECIES: TetR family transcriptional regulator [unclassified Acidovorax]GKT13159.1 TetR family transcriptional regulator [Acidovorax sp. SUPP2522]